MNIQTFIANIGVSIEQAPDQPGFAMILNINGRQLRIPFQGMIEEPDFFVGSPIKPVPANSVTNNVIALPVPRRHQTTWPLVGGEDLLLETNALFATSEFRERYQPGKKREIYIAGCSGLSELSKKLHMPIFKVGECGAGRIRTRIAELGKDQYGAAWYHDNMCMIEPGYEDYSSIPIVADGDISSMSPVALTPRGLVVTLPDTMDQNAFSQAFLSKMASCSWLHWCYTDEAARHLQRYGIDPAIALRFTPYQHGSAMEASEATELYCIRNTKDGLRLIRVIENVILEHLGLL